MILVVAMIWPLGGTSVVALDREFKEVVEVKAVEPESPLPLGGPPKLMVF
jgi:hypothetical protein